MIPDHWRRIAGFHSEPDGSMGVVWLAHDVDKSVIHCYDAARFDSEIPLVISDGITARGRYIPLAWQKKDQAWIDKFLDMGVNTLYDPVENAQSFIQSASKEIYQLMRGNRFRVDKSVFQWMDEAGKFYQGDKKLVPDEGFPLMSATRYAFKSLDYAKAQSSFSSKTKNHPGIVVF